MHILLGSMSQTCIQNLEKIISGVIIKYNGQISSYGYSRT